MSQFTKFGQAKTGTGSTVVLPCLSSFSPPARSKYESANALLIKARRSMVK